MSDSVLKSNVPRLLAGQQQALAETAKSYEKWKNYEKDFIALKQRLEDLPQCINYDVMVPLCKKAMVPGKLIHTNEILVLLGDNWFASRSASQAVDIVERRLKETRKMLCNLEKQRSLFMSHREFTQQIADEQNDYVEIREDYDSEEEEKRERVRNNRRTDDAKSKEEEVIGDASLWDMLDELERKETDNDELNNMDDVSSFEKESYEDKVDVVINDTSLDNRSQLNLPHSKKYVHWSDDLTNMIEEDSTSEDESKVIHFSHSHRQSDVPSVVSSPEFSGRKQKDIIVRSPADIVRIFGNESSSSTDYPCSILKNANSFQISKDAPVVQKSLTILPEPTSAISAIVVERMDRKDNVPLSEVKEPRRVSQFKSKSLNK